MSVDSSHLWYRESIIVRIPKIITSTALHLPVADGVFDGVFLCCSFLPLDVLDEIWNIIESVSGGFLTYSYRVSSIIR